ncbi:MAG: HEPN domain-containing protein [Bacteroidia bacterium]|nr:HEPN domain-containing protein [Bacteroidia bacterium]
MNNDELQYLKQWVAKAEEDLLVVRQLMNSEHQIHGAIAFHCQQSAEKFLKAFMAFHRLEIPRTHNIEFLLSQCSRIDNDFSQIDPGNLTDFGVEVRYPGDFLEPTVNEIDEMLLVVEKIRELTCGGLNF